MTLQSVRVAQEVSGFPEEQTGVHPAPLRLLLPATFSAGFCGDIFWACLSEMGALRSSVSKLSSYF